MTNRGLAFIGCRLLSLYFLYQAIVLMPNRFGGFLGIFLEGHMEGVTAIIGVFAVSVELVFAAFLWFGANWLSRKVSPADKQEDDQPPPSVETVLPQAIGFLGVYFLAISIPNAGSMFYSRIWLNAQQTLSSAEIVRVGWGSDIQIFSLVLQVCLGITLILGKERIALLLHKVRGRA